MSKFRKTLVALFTSLMLVCSVLLVAACNKGETFYKVTASYDKTKGTITLSEPKNDEGYAAGEEVTATVKANEGFEVETVTLNETAVTLSADGTYTFTVEKDSTIAATFAAVEAHLFSEAYIGTWKVPMEEARQAPVIVITADGITMNTPEGDSATYSITDLTAAQNGYDCKLNVTFKTDDDTEQTQSLDCHLELTPDGYALQLTETITQGETQQSHAAHFVKDGVTLPDLKLPAAYQGTVWVSDDMELQVAADGSVTAGNSVSHMGKVQILTLGEAADGKTPATVIYEGAWGEAELTADKITVEFPGQGTMEFLPRIFEDNYIGTWEIFYEQPITVQQPHTVWHGFDITITATGITVAQPAPEEEDEDAEPPVICTVTDIAEDTVNGGYTFKVQNGTTTWNAHIILTAENNALKAEGTPASGTAQIAVLVKEGLTQEFVTNADLLGTEWQTADEAHALLIEEDGGDVYLDEDPIWLTVYTDNNGTISFAGIYHADYVTGTMSATGISITVGSTTLAFVPKPEDLFGIAFRDTWTEIGDGADLDEIVIDANTLTYNGTAYEVTNDGGAGFAADSYSFEIDGKTYFFTIGADGYILQLYIINLADDNDEGEWKIFEGEDQPLPDIALPDFAGKNYTAGEASATFDAQGKATLAGDKVQIFAQQLEDGFFYLLWGNTYYTISFSEDLSTLTATDLYNNETEFHATIPTALHGAWTFVGSTIPNSTKEYPLTVNSNTVTFDGKESNEIVYTDEYGNDYVYYSFKQTFTYTLYFPSENFAIVRMASGNLLLYSKTSAETKATVFPEEYRDTVWTSESTFGNVYIDEQGNATLGKDAMQLLALTTTTVPNPMGFGSITVKTIHALCNDNYWTFTLGDESFTLTNQGQTTQTAEYVPLQPGPITDANDIDAYKGTWKIYGAEGTDTVTIGADGKFTYKGTEYGLLPTQDGGYSFDVVSGTGDEATTTTYTIGLTYGGKLLFVINAEEFEIEYFTKNGADLPNDGVIPDTYDGDYSNDYGQTLTIADGKMTLSYGSGDPVTFYISGVEASSDIGGHIAYSFSEGGYMDVFFTATKVEFHGLLKEMDLVFIKNGSSQGGGQGGEDTDKVVFTADLEGTWKQIDSADGGDYTVTITEGESTFKIEGGKNPAITATLVSLNDTEFTFTVSGVEGKFTVDILGKNEFLYCTFYDGNTYFFSRESEWNEFMADTKYHDTTWASMDETNSLTIDETGAMSWTKKDATESVTFEIFFKEESIAYALDASKNVYMFNFGDLMIEMTDITNGQDYTFLGNAGGGTGGEEVESKNVSSFFAGTWTVYGAEENGPILTITVTDQQKGLTEVTFAPDGSKADKVTVTAADNNGFTFLYDDAPYTLELLFDDKEDFLVCDAGFHTLYFVREEALTDLSVGDANFKGTTWTSEDEMTLEIDASGKITWYGDPVNIIRVVYGGFSGNIFSEAQFFYESELYTLRVVDGNLVLSLYGQEESQTMTFTKAQA